MGGLVEVTLDDVHAAAGRVGGVLRRTPLVYHGRYRSWFKLEQHQETGAYKVRGALNAILCQLERGDERPVVAASAGNHGAGVAWAARHVGLKAVIVVPVGAPRVKIETIRSLGAQVVSHGDTFEQSLMWAQACASSRGWRFLHAFDDPDVIAGQGTIALELLDLRPDVVAVPIGGGGLAAGMSIVLREAGVRLVGVQVAGVDAMASHLRGGPDRIHPPQTVADGLRVRESGKLTREICRQNLSGIELVQEQQVIETVQSVEELHGWTIEGAAAVTLAALPQIYGERRVALITGGNRDALLPDEIESLVAK